jgi:uncharacterized caspase-like protein
VALTVVSGTKRIYLPLLMEGQAAAPPVASKVALIIGIADYANMSTDATVRAGAPGNDLGYSVSDATDMVMRYEMGGVLNTFPGRAQQAAASADQIKVLLDSQATKAAIHAAIINWLDAIEDKNTTVMIYFSGHGMYAPDDNGDEGDPYDEFIVPYEIEEDNVGNWRADMAIRDDELTEWLSSLESQHIVIILDSCFSGGMNAAPQDTRARGLSWQAQGQRPTAPAAWQDGFAQDVQGPGRVVLMASAETQGSWEFGELGNGVFTYYLLEGLRLASADTNGNGWISAEEAFTYAANRVDGYVLAQTGEHQNPQIDDQVTGQLDLVQPAAAVAVCPAW